MTHCTALSIPVLCFALSVVAAPPVQEAEAEAPSPAETLAGMRWLAGTWEGAMWGGTFEAYYSTPDGGRILGHSRLVKDGEETFYEFEVFEVRGGAVRLAPYPEGRRVAGFGLAKHDPEAKKAVFENPDKDYPTRIVYERAADGSLTITLSDPHGGTDTVERFDLRRRGG